MNCILILFGMLLSFISIAIPYQVILAPEVKYAPKDAIPMVTQWEIHYISII